MSEYDEQAQRYLILLEGGPPSNYSAWSPDLPGCVATGASIEEVEREMRAAIALHLEGIAEDGGEIPEPSGPGVYVERKPRAAAYQPAPIGAFRALCVPSRDRAGCIWVATRRRPLGRLRKILQMDMELAGRYYRLVALRELMVQIV